MIRIEEQVTKKVPGETSLFISFDYRKELVDILKLFSGSNYSKKDKKWEVPITYLSRFLDAACKFDSIELRLLKEEKSQTKEFEIGPFKVQPFKHQEEAVQFGLNHSKWLLLDLPGLGKTLETILIAQELQKRGKVEHCLVICGLNTLKGNWRREIENFSDLSGIILGERVTKKGTRKIGSVAERAAHLMKPIDEFFVITNVESLRDDRIIDGILKGPNKFDMILLDEAHKCKGHSQQADGLLKLKSAPYKIAMTGTPIVSSPLDAYVPLTWLGIERGTRTNFKYYYCTFDGPFGNMVTGYKNMDVLQGIIDKHSLRRTKDILNLPPKMQIVEYVDMEPDQAQFYENIKQGIKDQVDKVKLNTTSLLALLTRLRQATSSPSILTTESISCAKIDRAVDLTEQIVANNEKVVIFTSFKEVTGLLAERLKQYNPLVCTGDSSEEFINDSKDRFQQDDVHQVFIATWQKMGTGLTLNRSSNVIFIDTPYTAADKQQAEDRCHRIGTKQTVNIYTLITAGTVDERVQEIVNKKEALSDYLVDGQITQEGLKSLKQYIEEL